MNKAKAGKIDSQSLALALVRKMVAYESSIDRKSDKTKAEKRHVEFLRAILRAGCEQVK